MKQLSYLFALLPVLGLAQQTNSHFSHTVATTASPEAVWGVWTDVPNWKQWDDGLREASIEGAFRLGATGRLVPDKGPKAKFKVTAFEAGKSYTFQTRIPFGWLVITRRLEVEAGKTLFTHEVQFTGLFGKAFGNSMGKRYRSMLPGVMEKINTLAVQR